MSSYSAASKAKARADAKIWHGVAIGSIIMAIVMIGMAFSKNSAIKDDKADGLTFEQLESETATRNKLMTAGGVFILITILIEAYIVFFSSSRK